ncbi:RDD family protein [Gilvimarinus sp. F26214L]|uniref:RDD family protein n=1 Tax=Gilvimarinus sp. DZF01 TaxID=3461371 RepID=UPI004045FD98
MSSITPHSNLPAASLPRRLAAMVYDSLLLLGLSFAYGGIFAVWIPGAMGRRPELGELAIEGAALFFFQLGWAALMIGFFLYFWRRGGQTLGMRAWRLRVQTPDGEIISLGQGLLRCIIAPLSLGLFGLGYLWCLLDPRGQTVHDRLSHTEVVTLPKEKR